MNWNERFARDCQPDLSQISAYIGSDLWAKLCTHVEETYNVSQCIEYSRCFCSPGWNVKYKKGSRALCTLYPREGFFTCLVTVGSREAAEAELMLGACTDYVRTLYWKVKPFNGARWLMIDVTAEDIMEDVKKLIGLRVRAK